MKTLLIALSLFPLLLAAQEENNLFILGRLYDGKPGPAPTPPVVPDFQINSTTPQVNSAQGAFHEVVDPELAPLPVPPEKQPLTLEEWQALRESPAYKKWQENAAKRKQTPFIHLTAKVYDRRHTLLYWWIDGKTYQAWSNIDFNYMGGFSTFQKDGQDYVMIITLANIDSQKHAEHFAKIGRSYKIPAIPELPADSTTQPTFQLIGDVPPEKTTYIALLHELYRQEHATLAVAYVGREKARLAKEEELRLNPPQPQIPNVHFWRGKSESESASEENK